MAFNINEFINNLAQGGARASLFQVQINNPVDASGDAKAPFMVRSASMPGSSLGFSEVPYFGRSVKVAGQRRYDDWAVTVINDEDFLVRNAMENWINALNSHEGNVRDGGFIAPSSYKVDASVTQYGKAGEALRTYKFRNLFPSDISPIGLDWGQTDVIEEFQVNFKYDYYTVEGSTGNIS
jgi:hypothetical protein|tara:strand:+ start:1158 stop:1700 length:543 start_codon:yes stop_codon:yes gene_type:complete